MRSAQADAGSDAWADRVDSADSRSISDEVNEYGGALLPQLPTHQETTDPARARSLGRGF